MPTLSCFPDFFLRPQCCGKQILEIIRDETHFLELILLFYSFAGHGDEEDRNDVDGLHLSRTLDNFL